MIQIRNLSGAGVQEITVLLQDGSAVQLTLRYRPAVQRWSMDVAWKTLLIRNIMMATHPNILRPWRNAIPFGICIATDDGTDPFMITDFEQERVKIYVLDDSVTPSDLAYIEETYFSA
jgi:hypothetical protein